ncbi:hypothetical protein PC120_g25437 [Phytophthora cactorum]|nr:hypothetical protein PC120_g25437 [Phytophthora cactorum]
MRALVLRDGLAVLVLVPVHEVPHGGLHQPVVKALDAQVRVTRRRLHLEDVVLDNQRNI